MFSVDGVVVGQITIRAVGGGTTIKIMVKVKDQEVRSEAGLDDGRPVAGTGARGGERGRARSSFVAARRTRPGRVGRVFFAPVKPT